MFSIDWDKLTAIGYEMNLLTINRIAAILSELNKYIYGDGNCKTTLATNNNQLAK